MESWKYHPGSNLYMISSHGRAKTFNRYPNGRIMKPNIDSSGYCRYNFVINGKATTTRVHILIAVLFLKHDRNSKLFVDHVDRNRLNNNVNNLRIVDARINSINCYPSKNSTSKYKGVSWDKRYKKWAAFISQNYKSVFIGYFDNEIECAKAYDKKSIEIFGEYATTNKMIGLI